MKDKLVFDCGANVGDFTRECLDMGARVVSVEPQAELTTGEKFRGAIIENVCISDKPGMVTLHECDVSTIASCNTDWCTKGRFKGSPWNRSREVPAKTLEQLIEVYGTPWLLKLDIEGYEHIALRGLKRKPAYVMFEYTQEFFVHTLECLALLQSLGYTKTVWYPMCKESALWHDPAATHRMYSFKEALAFLSTQPSGQMGDLVVS